MKKSWSTKLIIGTILMLVIGSMGIYSALAQDISQPPSAFEITTDGVFTAPEEWSDVVPAVRLNGESFVYTSADPGLGALYLMYDIVAGPTLPVFHVEFHNSGAQFDVFMLGGASISVFKDGIPFDPSDPAGGEASIQGAAGFGPSPNAATPHNMFELEVLFDGSNGSLNGHSHGQ